MSHTERPAISRKAYIANQLSKIKLEKEAIRYVALDAPQVDVHTTMSGINPYRITANLIEVQEHLRIYYNVELVQVTSSLVINPHYVIDAKIKLGELHIRVVGFDKSIIVANRFMAEFMANYLMSR